MESTSVMKFMIQTALLLAVCDVVYGDGNMIITAAGNVQTNEIKTGRTFSLCGDTFVMAWKYMCKYKQHQRNRVENFKRRSKRAIEDFTKPNNNKNLVSKTGALSFLKARHRRQAVFRGTDNANEECCYESCSYGEIAEYDC
eukprot:TCONS_00052680-protein